MTRLILASASPTRRALLERVGVAAESVPAAIDERAVEAPLRAGGVTPGDLAEILAEAKAVEVSERHPGALVIGADQTLSLADDLLHKPRDMEAARRQLLALSGRTHKLTSAVVLAQDGQVLWRHSQSADLTMRTLSPAAIGRYLAAMGERALHTVGSYEIEGLGLGLMDTVEGDHFTILGLPLLPLLHQLRARGAIDG